MAFEESLSEPTATFPAGWYPDHAKIEQCCQEAQARFPGPVAPTAMAIYLTICLTRLNVREVALEHLGKLYLSAIEFAVGCSLSALLNSQARNDYLTMPILAEFIHAMVTTSIEMNLPEVYAITHEFFHALQECEDLGEMVSVVEPFHDVIAMLDDLEVLPDDEDVRTEVKDLLSEAVQGFMRPYGSLPQSESQYATPEVQTPSQTASAPTVAAAPDIASVPLEMPVVAPRIEPGTVTHLDGSIGIDAHADLVRLFTPQRPFLSMPDAQWKDTLDHAEGTTKELLLLWKRLRGSKLDAQRLQEARLMDSVGRLLEYLFNAEQRALLAKRLPMEQVADNVLSFVSGTASQPPHMSIAQLRISLVSAAVIALTDELSLDREAKALWCELKLDSEVHLLLTTLHAHADALQERITKVVPPKHTFTLQ